MPWMTEVWAIRIDHAGDRKRLGASLPSREYSPSLLQAIVEARHYSDAWPPMPHDRVLQNLIDRGLGKRNGHNLSSLKSWIKRSR